jgi:hypothetical protein
MLLPPRKLLASLSQILAEAERRLTAVEADDGPRSQPSDSPPIDESE